MGRVGRWIPPGGVERPPYREFMEPLLDYIRQFTTSQNLNDVITIIVPQLIPSHWWENFLHTRTAEALRKELLQQKNIIITESLPDRLAILAQVVGGRMFLTRPLFNSVSAG